MHASDHRLGRARSCRHRSRCWTLAPTTTCASRSWLGRAAGAGPRRGTPRLERQACRSSPLATPRAMSSICGATRSRWQGSPTNRPPSPSSDCLQVPWSSASARSCFTRSCSPPAGLTCRIPDPLWLKPHLARLREKLVSSAGAPHPHRGARSWATASTPERSDLARPSVPSPGLQPNPSPQGATTFLPHASLTS